MHQNQVMPWIILSRLQTWELTKRNHLGSSKAAIPGKTRSQVSIYLHNCCDPWEEKFPGRVWTGKIVTLTKQPGNPTTSLGLPWETVLNQNGKLLTDSIILTMCSWLCASPNYMPTHIFPKSTKQKLPSWSCCVVGSWIFQCKVLSSTSDYQLLPSALTPIHSLYLHSGANPVLWWNSFIQMQIISASTKFFCS